MEASLKRTSRFFHFLVFIDFHFLLNFSPKANLSSISSGDKEKGNLKKSSSFYQSEAKKKAETGETPKTTNCTRKPKRQLVSSVFSIEPSQSSTEPAIGPATPHRNFSLNILNSFDFLFQSTENKPPLPIKSKKPIPVLFDKS